MVFIVSKWRSIYISKNEIQHFIFQNRSTVYCFRTALHVFAILIKILNLYFINLSNTAYLIFVIFFTQAKILDRKFYTEERVIYGKRISRQNSVNCYLLAQANYKYQDHEMKGRLGFSSLSFLVTEESALLAKLIK